MSFFPRFLAAALAVSAAAFAWQGGLSAIGLKDSDATQLARNYLLSSGDGGLPGIYSMSRPMQDLWKKKGPAERTQEIRELAVVAKAMVSTPAFEKAYNEWIKERYSAIDHGIKTEDTAAAMQKMAAAGGAEQMMSQVGAALASSMAAIPPPTLKMLFDQDLSSWKGDSSKAKIYAQAKDIAPLFQSKPEEWKRQYILLKSASMGGPSTEAGLAAAGAAANKMKADQQLRDQQRAWDERKLKVVLKRRLQAFVTLARSVDFTAQTQTRDRSVVFVKPEYERRSNEWKQLFRLGKDPTLAAVAAAEQWLKEL
jgi:hypothetical protein